MEGVKKAKKVKARDTVDTALYCWRIRISPKNAVARIDGYINNVSFQIVRPTFLFV